MAKILNVMDDKGNHKYISDGVYESGYWWRPPSNCEIIRLYKRDNSPSFLGGRIIGERVEERAGNKRKIFSFRDDSAQHGKLRPHHFGPNGCFVTEE